MLRKGSSGGTLMRDRPGALPSTFLSELRALEDVYLHHGDPAEQSGFYGGPERWRAEREPILEAIPADGELLDAGCANGYLLECLFAWGRERGVSLIPYGLDQGARLIELARRRQTHLADHFFIGNAWDWSPRSASAMSTLWSIRSHWSTSSRISAGCLAGRSHPAAGSSSVTTVATRAAYPPATRRRCCAPSA